MQQKQQQQLTSELATAAAEAGTAVAKTISTGSSNKLHTAHSLSLSNCMDDKNIKIAQWKETCFAQSPAKLWQETETEDLEHDDFDPCMCATLQSAMKSKVVSLLKFYFDAKRR